MAGGLVWMSLPANASTYLSGGSAGFFTPVLAKTISCCSRRFLSFQNSWFARQTSLGVHDADLPLGGGAQVGHMLLRVHVHARDEDAVDALEVVQPVLAALCARARSRRGRAGTAAR